MAQAKGVKRFSEEKERHGPVAVRKVMIDKDLRDIVLDSRITKMLRTAEPKYL